MNFSRAAGGSDLSHSLSPRGHSQLFLNPSEQQRSRGMQRLGRHKVWGLSGLSLRSVLQPHTPCLVIAPAPTINPKPWAKPQVFLFCRDDLGRLQVLILLDLPHRKTFFSPHPSVQLKPQFKPWSEFGPAQAGPGGREHSHGRLSAAAASGIPPPPPAPPAALPSLPAPAGPRSHPGSPGISV